MDLRMSSISQHISPQSDSQWGNEHHIWCNRHGFQPETTYPAFRRAAFCRSILSSPPESWPIEIMLYLFRLGAECIAHPLVWSHGASVRQLSFYGPVSLYLGILSLFGFQGATEAV